MASKDEVVGMLEALASAYNQPISDTDNEIWPSVLEPYDSRLCLEALEMYCTDVPTPAYFPKLPEFVNSVKELMRRDALKHTQSARTQAAFRCDGSRWRDHKEATNRDGTPGLEPCPSCNPVLYAELTDKTLNRQWRNGALMERDAILVAPKEPCTPHEQGAVVEPKVGLAHLHKANVDDWWNTRRDVM